MTANDLPAALRSQTQARDRALAALERAHEELQRRAAARGADPAELLARLARDVQELGA